MTAAERAKLVDDLRAVTAAVNTVSDHLERLIYGPKLRRASLRLVQGESSKPSQATDGTR